MLLAEHVLAQRRQGTLVLRAVDAAMRERGERIAHELIAIAASHKGGPRGELEEALSLVPAEPKDRKMRSGLTKLLMDRCVFASDPPVDPVELRAELFARAAAERRSGTFDRAAVVAAVAMTHGVDTSTLDRSLYADLKSSHALVSVDAVNAPALVGAFVRGQAQAVLLRAERVAARVVGASPGAVRALFRALKFHRLLFTAVPDGDAYVLGIDGPMSLFDAGTKYGPRLAMALPALEEAGSLELEAVVRWGKERERLVFRHDARSEASGAESPLPDEVESLRIALGASDTGLAVRRSDAILMLPGVGVCVPDLELRDRRGRVVYVEVLGFWSRDAVWKRIELAGQGLGARIVYCVSARLRVSEEALPENVPAALLVYKGTMSARAVVERARSLLERAVAP